MNERLVHQIFLASVLMKGAHAAIECIGGIALALVSTSTIADFVNALTQEELIQDPQDLIATHLLTWAQNFSVEEKHFYAYYFMSHGIVKLLLVIELLRNKLWSYPASLDRLGTLYRLSALPFIHTRTA
jgi:uncharacterized membrane protein